MLTVAAAVSGKTAAEAEATATLRRQSASTQFARAEEQRAALTANLRETHAGGLQTGGHRLSPRRFDNAASPRSPDSLLAVAELTPRWATGFGEATTSRH